VSGSLDSELIEWIRSAVGAPTAAAIAAHRHAGGASREGWAIDITLPDGTVEACWLRLDTGHGPQSDTIYTLRREATVYRALHDTPVRVPRVIAVHPTREAFLQSRLYGRNWFSEITDPAEQLSVASEFVAQIAELHRLPVAELDLPGFDTTVSLRHAVVDEIDVWEQQYRQSLGDPDGGGTGPEPLVAVALAWLRRNVPVDGPVVLVQGDTGPGNFMYADGRVVAVLDWEIAHIGDPHDDLAWICVRDLQERFPSLPDRFAEWERASGHTFDLDRLRYFRVLAQMRCAIGTMRGLAMRDSGGEMANHLVYSTMHLRVLGEALADVLGLQIEPATLPEPEPGEHAWAFDVALDEIRDTIVPGAASPFVAKRAKGLARLVKYLKEADRLGAVADEAERADLARVLGHEPASTREGRAAVCAAVETGTMTDEAVVAYGVRRMARLTQIMRPAMGALADRHYAPITPG
jgi:aminoglycoside phosphotransferase (APT) family kinase protein